MEESTPETAPSAGEVPEPAPPPPITTATLLFPDTAKLSKSLKPPAPPPPP
jgi:hypothetical protein